MDISDTTNSQESGILTTSPEEGPQTDASETIIGDEDNGKLVKIIDDKSPVCVWHPLMPLASPTESDSPNFNYPDLVLECNRLSRPTNYDEIQQESENISNGNVTTRKTTTTTATTTVTHRSPKAKKMDCLKVSGHKLKKKMSVLADPGMDFNDSSDSEDRSQYQATVGPSYNSVALVSNPRAKPTKHSISPNLSANRRRASQSADRLAETVSDEDSASNHSDTPNLVSLSPSSSIFDMGFATNDMLDDYETIPQYTAREEARDSRNWQKITLPDGKTREIDMKVIEPYKRILSHGGYLNEGGNNAIILFSSCHLPCKSRADYHYVMDNLFYYVLKTLEQLVTEDYILIYLHGGSSRSNVPPFPWLKKCYQLLDRRLRKSLKNLYMVHPTFWLKSIVFMSRPFISSKFWRKLVYVRTLEELYQLVPVIEKTAVPEKVKNYDSKHT